MNFLKYKYLLIIPLNLFLLTQVLASSFSMHKLAFLNWGNGANQVALTRAAPLNLGPPSIEQFGDSLYILDVAHQRILVVNTNNKQVSSIAYNAPNATDFCITKSGNFSLLFADAKQIITYNSYGNPVKTEKISKNLTPLSIYCYKTWVIDTFEGEFYSASGNLVSLRPFGKYQVGVELINSSQAKVQLKDYQGNYRFVVKALQGRKLEFIDVIGIDSTGQVFVTTEESRGKHLNRYLKKYSRTGKLIAKVKLPYSVYTYTLKDLAVSADGVVYQMVAHKNALKLVQWQTTRSRSRTSSSLLRDLFSYIEDNPNDFEPSEAPTTTRSRGRNSKPPRSRSAMMTTAKKYANYHFQVDYRNISRREYLDGKKVITPIQTPGRYIGVPYKWGGFDSLYSFQKGLNRGKKAGDICASHCSGVYRGSAEVVGIDCSGFVSRVWGLKSHQGTKYLPYFSNKISFNQLRPGDILNRRGRHVMLFEKKDHRGRFYVYEAVAGRVGKVIRRSHSYYYVKKYTPRRYQNIVTSSNSSPSYPVFANNKLERLVIYGNTTLRSGKSTAYRAKIIYSNDERRDVTNEVIWTDTSVNAQFKNALLKTKPVATDEEFFIKAEYREAGEVIKSGLRITLKASKSTTYKKNSLISLDFAKIYRPYKNSTEIRNLTNKSVLNSSNRYKLIFAPTKTTYVYIYQKDATGKIEQLFPNKVNSNPTYSGETYFVPSQTEWFFLDNNKGKEQFYLITSLQADKALEKQYKQVTAARKSNNYSQLRTSEKKLAKMLKTRSKSTSRGIGGIVSGRRNGLFSWKEYGTWFSVKRKRVKIKNGIVWSFQHK